MVNPGQSYSSTVEHVAGMTDDEFRRFRMRQETFLETTIQRKNHCAGALADLVEMEKRSRERVKAIHEEAERRGI